MLDQVIDGEVIDAEFGDFAPTEAGEHKCPVDGDPCYVSDALRRAEVEKYPFLFEAEVQKCTADMTGKCAVALAGLSYSAEAGSR